MMIRYIADTHFDHASILAYDNRPFDSVDGMNEAMIERWNAVVKDGDLTWILGDFCASEDPARWKAILSRLNGRKALITGNHDAPAAVAAALDAGLLERAEPYAEIEDGERRVVLCHYPIPSFRDHYFGWVHLYGHVHSAFEWNIAEYSKRLIKNLYAPRPVCQMANVGAMMAYMDYTPRSLDELQGQL